MTEVVCYELFPRTFQVFGIKDARLGEVVVAAVIKREHSQLGEEDVKKYCEGKVLMEKLVNIYSFITRIGTP